MQRMNMLYSDLYNVLLLLFIILAIGRLIFHLRRLIFLWTGYMKNKEVTELKNKIKGLTSSNEVLKEKLEDQVNKLKDAKVDRFVALESKAALQEVTALKNKIKGLTSSNEVLKEKLKDQVNKLKDAKVDTCVALESKAALEQDKILQTKSQWEKCKMQNSLLEEQIKSLRKNMATSVQEAAEARRSHEEDMKRLSNENESYCRQIANFAENIQKLINTTQEQENVKNLLINCLRAAHEKLAAPEEEISKTKPQCLDLERKNCLLQEENESLRTKLVTFSQEAAEAGKFIEEYMKRLSNENASYHSQIANNAEQIQNFAYTIQEQENVKNSLSNYLKAAHEKLTVAEEEISKTMSQCLDLERKNCLLQEEIKSLRTKIVTSSQEAAEAGKFNEEYMKRLSNENASYHSQIANNAEKIQKLAYAIQEQENVKNSLSNYLKAAHEKLAAAEEEISKAKSQCLDLERKNCLLQEENESLRTKLVTSSQEAAEAGKFNEEYMESLRNENKSYRRQIANNAEKIQKLAYTIQEQENVKNSLSNYLRAAYEKLAAAEVSIERGFISTSSSSALEAN